MRLSHSLTRVLTTILSLLSLLTQVKSSLILTLPPQHHNLPSTTHATLTTTSSHLRAPLTRHSTFTFPSTSLLPSTSYLLDIHSRDYTFTCYRVDVDSSGRVSGVWETFRGGEWGNKGPEVYAVKDLAEGNGESRDVSVEIRVLGTREYYEKRGSFSPLTLLKNPIVLLGAVGLAMAVGMPYLLDNMDPETRAEFEEQRKKSPLAGALPSAASGGGSSAVQGLQNFDLAGWMAGSGSGSKGSTGGSESEAASSGRDGGSARRR